MMVRYIYKPFDKHGRAGWYQCDLEDFKKFFSQIDHGGEVTLLLLRCERGSYMWTPENGWKRCGKKETAEN